MPPNPDSRRREELLDELEAIMLAEGFHHLRVGALATRLRCSRSTLYKLAPSKTELFAFVFNRLVDKAVDDADAQGSQLGTPGEQIIRYSEVIGEWVARGSATFWREARDTPELAEVLSVQRGRGYRVIQRYLDEGLAAGEVRPMDTGFVAYVTWMAGAAIRDPDRMRELGLTERQGFAELGRLLVKGISK